MAIPDYQSLMLPVLAIAAEGEARVPTASSRIADQLGLTEEEREEMLPSGAQRLLHNRIHWAKFCMSKAGLIESPKRGVFVATQIGRALLATKPDRIDVELLRSYPAFVEFYTANAAASSPAERQATTAATVSNSTPKSKSTRHMPF